jgi:hypothetical protein
MKLNKWELGIAKQEDVRDERGDGWYDGEIEVVLRHGFATFDGAHYVYGSDVADVRHQLAYNVTACDCSDCGNRHEWSTERRQRYCERLRHDYEYRARARKLVAERKKETALATVKARRVGLAPVENDPKRESRTYWCGPTSVAAIAGIKYSEAEALCKAKINHKLMGMWPHEVFEVLKHMGLSAQRYTRGEGLRLGDWELRTRGDRTHCAVMLLELPGHFVAVNATTLVDTAYRKGIAIEKSKHVHRKVEHAWIIE